MVDVGKGGWIDCCNIHFRCQAKRTWINEGMGIKIAISKTLDTYLSTHDLSHAMRAR
jgi:hypothetical protein